MNWLLPALKSFAAEWLMPIPLALLLLAISFGIWWLGFRRLARLLAVCAVALPVLAAWQPVSESLLAELEDRHVPSVQPASEVDVSAIVVLGAGWVPRNDRPMMTQLTPVSALRLVEGLRLADAHPQARLIVTGGTSRLDLLPVADGYALAAKEFGIDPERITALPEPLNTAQEARAVRALLSPSLRFLLVTSATHMPRAVANFRAVGLNPLPAPTEYLSGRGRVAHDWFSMPSARHLQNTERALIEYMGLAALPLEHRK